jgi:phosphoribosylanthranilate isomerase
MVRVKICGITNLDDALAAVDAGADALGFVFAEEAKRRNRYIDLDAAAAIIRELPPFVTTVGVCVNDSAERLREYLRVVDCVQLHGEEPPAICAEFSGRAIRAFRAGPGFDVHAMAAYPARAYLLDSYQAGTRGGTGTIMDWRIARQAVDAGMRIVVAGGLTPENVADAVAQTRPYAVDTSGGVEGAPGKKDHDRLRDFVRQAKLSVS